MPPRARSPSHSALYQAPDHFAFLLSDGADGTPIAFAVDRDLLVYDFARPQLMYFSGVTESDIWGAEGGKLLSTLKHNFSGHGRSQIVVDFKAMFESFDEDGTPTRDSVVKVTATQYILIKKRKKLYLRSRVDPTRACPFTTLEYADGPDADPNFCIDKVVVNGALSPTEFVFPSKQRMAEKLTVQDVSAANSFNQLEAMTRATALLSMRDRLHKPALHRGLIAPALMGVRGAASRRMIRPTRSSSRNPSLRVLPMRLSVVRPRKMIPTPSGRPPWRRSAHTSQVFPSRSALKLTEIAADQFEPNCGSANILCRTSPCAEYIMRQWSAGSARACRLPTPVRRTGTTR